MKLDVKNIAPNTLTLDYCDIKLGDTTEKDLYFYSAANKIYRHHGLEGKSLEHGSPVQNGISSIKIRFAPDSGFEARFPVFCR